MPNVHAPALHALLDAVEAEVLAFDPSWSAYIPPPAPSPWTRVNGEWWPKPAESGERGDAEQQQQRDD